MKKLSWVLLFGMILTFTVSCTRKQATQNVENEYVGSSSCIECHEKFYDLWSPSHHGKAMQPLNAEFLSNEKLQASEDFFLEEKTYRNVY